MGFEEVGGQFVAVRLQVRVQRRQLVQHALHRALTERRVGVLGGLGVQQPYRRLLRQPHRTTGSPLEGEQPRVLRHQLLLSRPGRQREVEAVAHQQQRRAGGDIRRTDHSAATGRTGAVRLAVEGRVQHVPGQRADHRVRTDQCRLAPRHSGRRTERHGFAGLDDVPAHHRRERVPQPGRSAADVAGEVSGAVARVAEDAAQRGQ